MIATLVSGLASGLLAGTSLFIKALLTNLYVLCIMGLGILSKIK